MVNHRHAYLFLHCFSMAQLERHSAKGVIWLWLALHGVLTGIRGEVLFRREAAEATFVVRADASWRLRRRGPLYGIAQRKSKRASERANHALPISLIA